MSRIKLKLDRRYLTQSGLVAGPFWPNGKDIYFFGKIGAGDMSFRGSYDASGNYRATSIERQRNPEIDAQLRIVSECQDAFAATE